MTYGEQPECAREFLERAKDQYADSPSAVLLEVRRFAQQRDTAEFTTQQRVVMQCTLGRCTVELSMKDGELTVDAPLCPRRKSLTN